MEKIKYKRFGNYRFTWSWLFILFCSVSFSQANLTTLKEVLSRIRNKEYKHDTTLVRLYYTASARWQARSMDSSLWYSKQAVTLARKINYPYGIAVGYNTLGFAKSYFNEFDSALYYLKQSETMLEKMGRRLDYSASLSGIARVYYMQSKFNEAIKYHLKALKVNEEIKDKLGESITLGDIGRIHYELGEHDMAIEYVMKALKLDSIVKNEEWSSRHHGSLGNVYQRKGDVLFAEHKISEANSFYHKGLKEIEIALAYAEESQNKNEAASQLTTLGNIYHSMGDSLRAIELYKQALQLEKEVKNINGMAAASCNLGWLCYEKRNYKEAEEYTLSAIQYAEKANSLYLLSNLFENMSLICEDSQQYEKGLQYYKKFVQAKDSIYNYENAKRVMTNEMNFEQSKKDAIAKEEATKQKIIRNSFISGFGLMLILAIVIFRGYREKKKSNDIISEQKREMEIQKELVQIKNTEIVDSIQYAKRIQTSLLPTEKYFENALKQLERKR